MIVGGNSVVLAAVALSRNRLNSRMNFFIVNLALADMMVGIIYVLTDIIWKTTIYWYAGEAICKIVRFAQALALFVSTYILVALSLDRLDAVARPMHFSGNRLRLLLIVWSLSIAFSFPLLLLYRLDESRGGPQCWIELTEIWHWQVYLSFVATVLFIIPAILILGCYAAIVYIIWRSRSLSIPDTHIKKTDNTHHSAVNGAYDRSVESTPSRVRLDCSNSQSSTGLISKARIRTIKMTFAIVIVFIICWSPYFLFNLLQVFGFIPDSQTSVAVATFVQSLAPLNSAANPIIYGIFSTRICRNLRKIKIFDRIARTLSCCATDDRDKRSPHMAQTTDYSTIDLDTPARHIAGRRPTGVPRVYNNVTERDKEILLKTFNTNQVNRDVNSE